MKIQNVLRIVLITGALLLIPLIAMQFTDEVAWTLSDFIFAGVLLMGSGFAYEFAARKRSTAYRAAAGMAIFTAFLLIWVNLAVGIIGSEDNIANALYIGVLAVLLIGTMVSRLRSQGMSKTLYATALAQLLVPVIAFIIWRPDMAPGVVQVFVLNAVFAVFWIGSGLLFARAETLGSISS